MEVLEALGVAKTVLEIATPIIETVTSKLAPEMKQFAERLYVLSEKYPRLEEWAKVIEKGSEILTAILYAIGIDCDAADILGFKAGQTDKNLSEFDSAEDYVKYLHDEVDLDKEKFESLSDEEKMAYRATGMAVEASVISEKMGVDVTPDFTLLLSKLKDIGDIALEGFDLASLLGNLKENDITNTNDIVEYFAGRGDSDRIHTGEVLRTKFEEFYGKKASDIIEEIKIQERQD